MWELSLEPEAEPIFSPCLKRLLPHASLPPSPTPSQSSLPFINHPWLVGQRALCWELSGVRTAVERTHTHVRARPRARTPPSACTLAGVGPTNPGKHSSVHLLFA